MGNSYIDQERKDNSVVKTVRSKLLGTTPCPQISIVPSSTLLMPKPGDIAYIFTKSPDKMSPYDPHFQDENSFSWEACPSIIVDASIIDEEVNAVRTYLQRGPFSSKNSPIGEKFREVLSSYGAKAALTVVEKLSIEERAYPPSDIGKLILQEILEELLEQEFTKQMMLDTQVVSYVTYVEDLKDTLVATDKQTYQIPSFTPPTPGQDVLIACGQAWDSRCAVDILPQSVLAPYASKLLQEAQREGYLTGGLWMHKTFLEYAAQGMVENRSPSLAVNHTCLQLEDDFEIYKEILEHEDIQNPFSGSNTNQIQAQHIGLIDSFRVVLRRAGFPGTEQLQKHADVVRSMIIGSQKTWNPEQAMAWALAEIRAVRKPSLVASR
jgi:hypothetical protein